MLFDFADTSNQNVYKLLVATIGPRPIAWVTTKDVDGTINAAPFSFFNAMSGNPPVLAFGIGDTSKVVTSWVCVVFMVFYNVFAGARSVDEGFMNAARLLGASEWQITRTVVIPSTMAWLFASLTPAIANALIGVIVGEFIGAEHGIGRLIIESEARGEASGMMVAVLILMVIGVILSTLIWRLQAYLLRWQAETGRGVE